MVTVKKFFCLESVSFYQLCVTFNSLIISYHWKSLTQLTSIGGAELALARGHFCQIKIQLYYD